MDDPKKNPPIDDSLAAESNQGADDASVLPGRLDRYAKAHQRTVQMADYATREGEVKLADRLANCGNYLLFRDYFTVGKIRLHAARFCCKHLLCPLCAIRRGAKQVKAYSDRLAVLKAANPLLRASLVTFTLKNGPDLLTQFNRLYRSLARFHKTRNREGQHNEACKAEAAVWSYEIKRGANSREWHVHVHCIWLHLVDLDAFALSKQWHQVTGDSFIVDVTPFHDQDDVISGFLEVFKYAMKFSDLPFDDNWHAFEMLQGRRLIGSFGAFRGVVVPEELTDEPLDELPYIEHFFRYITGAGYALQKRGEW